ncbi:hypothetical protein FI667_g4671, partial [Globisporangium splendens]
MKVVPVRIGSRYQVDLPELLPLEERQKAAQNTAADADTSSIHAPARTPAPRYRQRWTPTRFTSEEVTEFLRGFCRLNEVEMCLHESDYQVQTAVQLLHAARRRKDRKKYKEEEHMNESALGSAIVTHGKKFFLIQQQFDHISTGDVIRRFYLWKTSAAYARWRERIKARRNKETVRLRAWGDSEADSEASDFHNEYCELCCTGGQLLCCDGCERAYHFSCVTPPINEIPTGDWFCSHCSNILEKSLSVKQSDENEFCDEAVVDDEGIVDGSDVEHIDDDDDDDDETLDLDDLDDSEDEYTRKDKNDPSSAARSSPLRNASSSTDNDESDGGSRSNGAQVTIKVEAQASDTTRAAGVDSSFRVKQEPHSIQSLLNPRLPHDRGSAHQQPRRTSEVRKFVSPAKAALALEPSSNERKRKRKIEAPRRIPQQKSNF